jgi:hypothetical protein
MGKAISERQSAILAIVKSQGVAAAGRVGIKVGSDANM